MRLSKRMKDVFIFLFLLFTMAILPTIILLILGINADILSEKVKMWCNLSYNIIMLIIIFLIYRKDTIKDFKNYFKNFGQNFETSFKYYIAGLGIMIVSNLVIAFFFKGASANNEEAVRNLISLYPVYMLFSVAIYAPFVEENIFRKSIKNIIVTNKNSKWAKYLYIFVSGFVFALLHIVGMANGLIDYLYVIPYLALGIAFAALYYKSDNIFSSIIVHALHNTVAVLLYIIFGVV